MDRENILESITNQCDSILQWAKKSITDEKELRMVRMECLMNQLTLNRIRFAHGFNPAVAVIGEVQVGKSYLVNNLLTTFKSPLRIYDGMNPNGYGFIEEINPIGGGKASTGLISRFTISHYSDNPEYPICTVMLTPVDVVLILCDTYYNDVIKHKFPDKEEIKETVKSIKERYDKKPEVQSIIRDVGIFEIKDYIENTQFAKGDAFIADLLSSDFFETLSECITRIDIHEWREVFEFLWNRETHISELFDLLISTLQTLDFARKCYIKIDALLRKDGTILEVDRLYELFALDEVYTNGKICKVYGPKVKEMEVWNGEKIVTLGKSKFCALATEVVFNITDMDDLSGNSDLLQEKPFLKYIDMLDFPGGARCRLLNHADQITKVDTCAMYLWGKLSYLYNKYIKQFLISNLMFCHHDVMSGNMFYSSLLHQWIQSVVGKTPEERSEYTRYVSRISPLFIVETKLNTDLVVAPIDSFGSEEEKHQAKKSRWTKRFNSTLGDLIREPHDNPWFSQWTPGKPFQNIYLVRNFRYSCLSGVYEGYMKRNENGYWVDNYVDGVCREERFSDYYQKFIPELKRTFLENDFVQAHFENPEKSWDEAVNLNHDGTAWLIENLYKAAIAANKAREIKVDRLLMTIMDRSTYFSRVEY